MRDPVVEARNKLRETLGHWKDGTRPGDDTLDEGDVMVAIVNLVQVMIARHDAASEHGR